MHPRTGELAIHRDRFQAYVGERSLNLTRREFELLWLLVAHAGRVLKREAIHQHVWGCAMAHGDRTVDVFVRKLRSKLERGSRDWRYVHAHVGVGYRFEPLPAGGGAGEEPEPAAPQRGWSRSREGCTRLGSPGIFG